MRALVCRSADGKDGGSRRGPSHHAATLLPSRLLASLGPALAVQPKLTIGASDTPAERQADEIAEQVMRTPSQEGDAPLGRRTSSSHARMSIAGGKCGACREETALRKAERPTPIPGLAAHHFPASREVDSAVRNLGSGLSLPASDRHFFESRFSRDFAHVRLHAGPQANRACRAMGARAFTLGNDIAVADGEYRPASTEGRRLLAHELVHTIQQQGAVSRTVQRRNCAAGGKCSTEDGTSTASGKFSMTIYADKEGPFLLIPATKGVGHSWLRLENDKGKYWTYGFWPKTGFDAAHPAKDVTGCVVHPDATHTATSSQTFELTAAEFSAAFGHAVSVCTSPPPYNLFGLNCTSFVANALDKAGHGSFGGFGLIWENPNALDSWIREHSLQLGASATAVTTAEEGAGSGAVGVDLSYRHQFYSMLGHKVRLYGFGRAEYSGPVKTIGAGAGISLDAQKVWLPSIYVEGMGAVGDMNPLKGKTDAGAGVGGGAGLKYNIDAFGSVGIEYNLLKDFARDDPALNRVMIKVGINLW